MKRALAGRGTAPAAEAASLSGPVKRRRQTQQTGTLKAAAAGSAPSISSSAYALSPLSDDEKTLPPQQQQQEHKRDDTSSKERKLTPDGRHFYNICRDRATAGAFGATQDELQSKFDHLSETAFGQLINTLLEQGWIEVKQTHTAEQRMPTLVFCAVDEADHSKKASLTNEERVCYDLIRDSGNVGIWVKDIIRSSNLHRQVVTSASRVSIPENSSRASNLSRIRRRKYTCCTTSIRRPK